MSDLSATLASFLDKRSRLAAAKANQKAALEALGRSPGNDWSAYPDELRAVTGGSGTYQDSKTVTADPAGMTITPDEGYSGMLKAIIAAEPNFQSYNLVEGIEAWGITGTAKPATTSDAPTNLPVSKDDADTAYETQSGAAPTETDYFVCVDNDGNITYWYLSDDFTITSYDPITTEFKATGAIRMAYHTTGESVGTWTLDDFTSAESGGWNYLKNIRSCTREKLYYTIDGTAYEVWPNSAWGAADNWNYNGTVLPKLPQWDKTKYPYVLITYYNHDNSSYEKYYLLTYSEKPIVCNYTTLRFFSTEGAFYSRKLISGKWGEPNSNSFPSTYFFDGVWANHDILSTTDNTVFLAESNPVPVEVS